MLNFDHATLTFVERPSKNSTHSKHSNPPIQGGSVDASDLTFLGVAQSHRLKAHLKWQATNRGLERSVEPKHFQDKNKDIHTMICPKQQQQQQHFPVVSRFWHPLFVASIVIRSATQQ